MTTSHSFTTVVPPLPFVNLLFDTQVVVRRSLRQSAADTPLARWLVEYGESRGWATGRQAAKYLGVKQAAFSTWLRGEVEPSREYQDQLAAATGRSPAFVAELVRQTKAEKLLLTGEPTIGVSVGAVPWVLAPGSPLLLIAEIKERLDVLEAAITERGFAAHEADPLGGGDPELARLFTRAVQEPPAVRAVLKRMIRERLAAPDPVGAGAAG